MASTLQQALDPATSNAFTPTLLTTQTQATPAQLSDASDATFDYAESDDGSGTLLHDFTMDTLTGDLLIDFVRWKHRSKKTGSATSLVRPYIASTQRGSQDNLTASFVNYSRDLSTDPADAQPWTVAKINAQTWGYFADVDGGFGTQTMTMPEFEVEVWGWVNQTSTPASVSMTATANAGTVARGPVSSAPDSVVMTASGGIHRFELTTLRDPEAVTALGNQQGDGTVTAEVVARIAAKAANLKDENLGTIVGDAATGPGADTLVADTSGTDKADIQGETDGPISYIVMHCYARMRQGDGAASHVDTASNARFTWGSGNEAVLTAAIPSGAYSSPPDQAHRQTGNITTIDGAAAWTWANIFGVDGLLAASLWQLKVDVNPGVGEFADLDTAEVWVDVYGPIGQTPDKIELQPAFRNVVRVQSMHTVIGQ